MVQRIFKILSWRPGMKHKVEDEALREELKKIPRRERKRSILLLKEYNEGKLLRVQKRN